LLANIGNSANKKISYLHYRPALSEALLCSPNGGLFKVINQTLGRQEHQYQKPQSGPTKGVFNLLL